MTVIQHHHLRPGMLRLKLKVLLCILQFEKTIYICMAYLGTDHKPLVPIYNSYRADIPLRIQKHKLNLQGYNFTLIYEPGKDNPMYYTSRHPLPATNTRAQELKDIDKLDFYVKCYSKRVRDDLPTAVTIERLWEATSQDDTLQLLIKDIVQGYVSTENIIELSAYLHVFQELSVVDGSVLRGTKPIVLPDCGKLLLCYHVKGTKE